MSRRWFQEQKKNMPLTYSDSVKTHVHTHKPINYGCSSSVQLAVRRRHFSLQCSCFRWVKLSERSVSQQTGRVLIISTLHTVREMGSTLTARIFKTCTVLTFSGVASSQGDLLSFPVCYVWFKLDTISLSVLLKVRYQQGKGCRQCQVENLLMFTWFLRVFIIMKYCLERKQEMIVNNLCHCSHISTCKQIILMSNFKTYFTKEKKYPRSPKHKFHPIHANNSRLFLNANNSSVFSQDLLFLWKYIDGEQILWITLNHLRNICKYRKRHKLIAV